MATNGGRPGRDDRAARKDEHSIRDLIPLAIVLAAILAAVAGWRASVSEEHGSHFLDLARQARLNAKEVEARWADQAEADFRAFTLYEQASLRELELVAEARRAGGRTHRHLLSEARKEVAVSRGYLAVPWEVQQPEARANGTLAYDFSYFDEALERAQQRAEEDAATLPEADELRARSRASRGRGVALIGLGAGFVLALVLFTASSLTQGRWSRAFGLVGVVVTVGFIVAFLLVSPPWHWTPEA